VQPGIALERAKARAAGLYALHGYLPVSLAARTFRNGLRRLRGQSRCAGHAACAGILVASAEEPSDRIDRDRQSDGNVRLSELAVLALAASDVSAGSEIVEIGTFDGRTALNLGDQCAGRRFDRDPRPAA